ncbi:hypothetical protein [Dongia sp.]|uniref:hypothetical protein n=1 Tax=Dongia sp. TaxID=1977262 RepID=UPI0035B49467
MKFNISYFGPEPLFHLRRDFLLALKYGLESLGHDVVLSGLSLESNRFNLIVGAYFLPSAELKKVAALTIPHAHVNTEVIAQDMLNFNPQKTDFLGAYLPAMQAGRFVWDVIMDNMAEHQRYGNNAHFLRWGWHPKLEDIEHRQEKDLDFYFFGLMSGRRREILQTLQARGLKGVSDGSCPYFLRNDRIARAKVQLNIIQEDKYTHVNSFRICYLANNRCAILSEHESDPANYLALAQLADRAHLGEAMADLIAGDKWRALGERAYADFRAVAMRDCLAELLDRSLSGAMV